MTDPVSNPIQPDPQRMAQFEAQLRAAERDRDRIKKEIETVQEERELGPPTQEQKAYLDQLNEDLDKAVARVEDKQKAVNPFYQNQSISPPATEPAPTTVPKPAQGGRRNMSRKVGLGIVVVVALIVGATGIWFGGHTENLELQMPVTWDWKDDSSTPPASPAPSQNPMASPEASQAPISEEASPSPEPSPEYSPPPGSETITWACAGPADETDTTVTFSKDYCQDP